MAYIEREKAKELIKNFGKGAIEDGQYALDSVDDIILLASAVDLIPSVDVVEVVHARWEDGQCSNCKEEALSTSWDEPIYDYDWEENLQYSHTETHTEYHLTDYCPNCGAKMDGERKVSE